MAKRFRKYDLLWEEETDPLDIEFFCIRKGGQWKDAAGKEFGRGLLFHYLEARKHVWPKRYGHRWVELIYSEILKNEITILMGAASTGKTSTASEFCLLDYWCFPETTAIIVSTVNIDKLDMAVFGELKMLFHAARELRPNLPGKLLAHRRAITTDSAIDDEDVTEAGARDFRKGIIGRPCYAGGRHIGLGVYAGIKQERVRFLCDELQFMSPTFLSAWPNMFSNPDVKIIGSGNPKHDPDDQLGIAAEPREGWAGMPEPSKTAVWPTKYLNGACLNLVGTDSPNFDTPADQKEPFSRLIGRRFFARLEHDYGKDSPEYYTQGKGVMRLGLAHARVITRQLCREHHAHDQATWESTVRTKVHALDPAYGGGDRCISGWGEFGRSADGSVILRVNPPRTIKINLLSPLSPEDQIAEEVARELEENHIPVENSGYDSFGKGTIGFAFARKFGHVCPVPVDSGGRCTNRPVRADLMIYDESIGRERLKTCAENYSKFVTEMWFSVRYTIEANQLRELPEDVMAEGCWREYRTVAGDKIEVEKKEDMRERSGKSPDLFDWLAVLVEMARRRGFVIDRLGVAADSASDDDWFQTEADEYDSAIKSHMLTHK